MARDMFTKPLFGSPAKELPNYNPEMAQALAWLLRIREQSNFDLDVLTYPATSMLAAYVKSTQAPILYVPIQKVMMLDALGPNPQASPVDVAQALAQIIKTLHYESFKAGQGEVYFPCTDERVNAMAKHHGFIDMNYEEIQPGSNEDIEIVKRKPMPFMKMKVYS